MNSLSFSLLPGLIVEYYKTPGCGSRDYTPTSVPKEIKSLIDSERSSLVSSTSADLVHLQYSGDNVTTLHGHANSYEKNGILITEFGKGQCGFGGSFISGLTNLFVMDDKMIALYDTGVLVVGNKLCWTKNFRDLIDQYKSLTSNC